MDDREKASRGHRAEQLLKNELLVEAFSAIETALIQKWRDADNLEERERAWFMLKCQGTLKGYLEQHVTTGKIATQKLRKEAENG